jgi:soluble lytic murein transglycosylase
VGLDEEAENALRAHENALRKKYKERASEALCRTYGLLESAKRRFQIAQTAASWSVLKFEPRPDQAWQWECIYPTPYDEVVRAEAEKRAVPPGFIYGVMRQESAFRPTVVSPADAVGLMQIIPSTASRIAQALGKAYDPDLMRAPAVNISFGAYYLRFLQDIFQSRLELVAASYNAGPHAVTRWLRAGESLPLDVFIARIPYEETRNYVYRVMGNYARYAYLDDGTEIPMVDLKIPAGMKAPDSAY